MQKRTHVEVDSDNDLWDTPVKRQKKNGMSDNENSDITPQKKRGRPRKNRKKDTSTSPMDSDEMNQLRFFHTSIFVNS